MILMEEYRLLMNTVGKKIACYSPGTTDMTSLLSAGPLVALITNEQNI